MKILISRKDLRNTASGVPRIVIDELQYFHQHGHQAYAIAETIDPILITKSDGIPIKTYRFPFSGYYRRRFYQWRVQCWIKRHHPDLVIGHGDILHQDILFIHNCVHLAHELIEKSPLPEDDEVGKIQNEIFKRGSFKTLVCNSKMMKEDLVKRFKLDPSKVVVTYPEVNLTKFRVERPDDIKREWREKFGIPQDAFVFGLVTSGNHKKRNLDLLIKAFKTLNKIYPRIHLFVGGGKFDDHYKEMISQNVTFAPTEADVKNYFYLIDAFVLPAFIEEFGISVLEAMYCRKPVIVSSQVGAGEIIEGIGRELILSRLDEEELVQKMEMLLKPDFFQEVSQQDEITAHKFNANLENRELERVLVDLGIKAG